MPKYTVLEEGQAELGVTEMTNLLRNLLRVYRFRNHNQNPDRLVLPIVREVDGVSVVLSEEADNEPVTSGKTNSRKR
jgi:hypothetical protein